MRQTACQRSTDVLSYHDPPMISRGFTVHKVFLVLLIHIRVLKYEKCYISNKKHDK